MFLLFEEKNQTEKEKVGLVVKTVTSKWWGP